MNDVKRVVRQNGAELQQKIQEKAEFTKGYQTGQTKRSVNLEIKAGGFPAEAYRARREKRGPRKAGRLTFHFIITVRRNNVN